MKAISVTECRKKLHHGLIPAVPVPFDVTGQIDASAQYRFIAKMAAQPIAGVAVWAHTGRGLLLNREQRISVLRGWRDGLGSDKTVIASIGGPPQHSGTKESFIDAAVRMATDAMENGAHALMVYPPTFFRQSPDWETLTFDYHQRIASLGVPLILFYLYEAAGGISYSPELLRRLFALSQVVGIKLATLNSVITFQDVARLIQREFPETLLITGEDRFLGYSFMCGAQAALIGMGAACVGLQHNLMRAYFEGRAKDFMALSQAVDELGETLFVAPMEGYIGRMLLTLVHEGVIGHESSHDPWGPKLSDSEFARIGEVLQRVTKIEQTLGC
jgi:4-hydroxy-tetrahydrodipicolinate synthase